MSKTGRVWLRGWGTLLLLSVLSACATHPETELQASPHWTERSFYCESDCYAVGKSELKGDSSDALAVAKQAALERLKTGFWAQSFDHPPYPQLEDELRQTVISRLSLLSLPPATVNASLIDEQSGEVFVQLRVTQSDLKARFAKRMKEIESQLREFIYMGDSGLRIQQLQTLLPALPLIEEYRRYQLWLKEEENPLVTAMDRKLTILFHRLLVTLEESIPESLAYEKALKDALQEQGVSVSAKQPDLVLEYYMDTNQSKAGVQALVNMVLLQQDESRFADYQKQFSLDSLSEEEKKQWVDAVSEAVYQALQERLIELVYPQKAVQPSS